MGTLHFGSGGHHHSHQRARLARQQLQAALQQPCTFPHGQQSGTLSRQFGSAEPTSIIVDVEPSAGFVLLQLNPTQTGSRMMNHIAQRFLSDAEQPDARV